MEGVKDTLRATLLSLFSVAYKCRCTLPILVSVGFMLLDVNIRLEFQVDAHPQDQQPEQRQLRVEEPHH